MTVSKLYINNYLNNIMMSDLLADITPFLLFQLHGDSFSGYCPCVFTMPAVPKTFTRTVAMRCLFEMCTGVYLILIT